MISRRGRTDDDALQRSPRDQPDGWLYATGSRGRAAAVAACTVAAAAATARSPGPGTREPAQSRALHGDDQGPDAVRGRQGTERNRKAVDWIEAELRRYGCPTERLKYEYRTPPAGERGRGRS